MIWRGFMNDFVIADDDKVRKLSSLNDLSQLIFSTEDFFPLKPMISNVH
jgi:hypothetical protein